ncbi:MAG: DNA-binding protein [Chthoniobacterales bacterium]|nr:DNA-binding protein [Chthoniobacterales bacterium]
MRPGVTLEEVRSAIHRIVQRGQNPSVHAVRRELGRGSMTTLLRLVREVKSEGEHHYANREIRTKRESNEGGINKISKSAPPSLLDEDRRALLRQLEKLTEATLLIVRHLGTR